MVQSEHPDTERRIAPKSGSTKGSKHVRRVLVLHRKKGSRSVARLAPLTGTLPLSLTLASPSGCEGRRRRHEAPVGCKPKLGASLTADLPWQAIVQKEDHATVFHLNSVADPVCELVERSLAHLNSVLLQPVAVGIVVDESRRNRNGSSCVPEPLMSRPGFSFCPSSSRMFATRDPRPTVGSRADRASR